jgi:undecaprenyl-diphosphatase
MNLFHAVIFGIVEGLSEFLPISSTGHLILTARVLGLNTTEFLKSFEVAIQSGAILAVVALYWRRLFVDREVQKRVLAACIPTFILGFIFYHVVKKYLLASEGVVLWALFVGGIFLVLFELAHREKEASVSEITSMPYLYAFLIGIAQTIAMVPGVSRAAATICCGLFLGMKRKAIVEFSFLLAVPTMFAATVLDLSKSYHAFSSDQFRFLAVGFVFSFFMAILAIKGFIKFIQKYNFIPFGIYRIILSLLFWFFWPPY